MLRASRILPVAAIVQLSVLAHFAVADAPSFVLSLTNETFESALKDHPKLMVEFYAPWCRHCQSLEPEYEAAARLLNGEGSDIRLAKVDATVYQDLGMKHGVQGFPTLLFFVAGKGPRPYSGPRNGGAIVEWLKKKLGPQAAELKDKADVERLRQREVAVVGFFKAVDNDAAKVLVEVADRMEKQTFGYTTSMELFNEYGVDPESESIVLFKHFDDGRAVHSGDLSPAAIEKFVKSHSLPLVTEFKPEIAQEIFTSEVQAHLLMFSPKTADAYQQLLTNARKIAEPFRGKILFVVVDADHEEAKGMLDFFGLTASQMPTYRMVRVGVNEMKKYRPETDDISPEAIGSFTARYLAGELHVYLASQDLPADWDSKPVKVLVATNYQSVVKDSGKKVLVEYYAPWCGHCKQLAPIWEQLGEKYKDVNDLIIAKMDATANEIEDLQVGGYPTIKFFLPGQEKEIDYNGPRTLEGLSKFVESDGKEGNVSEDVPEELEPELAEEGESKHEESYHRDRGTEL